MKNENLTLSECQIDFFNNKTKIDERCVQWLCQKTNYTFAVEFVSDEEMALADDSIKSSIINGCIDNNCPYLYSNESSNLSKKGDKIGKRNQRAKRKNKCS